jgi:hypothetical protein
LPAGATSVTGAPDLTWSLLVKTAPLLLTVAPSRIETLRISSFATCAEVGISGDVVMCKESLFWLFGSKSSIFDLLFLENPDYRLIIRTASLQNATTARSLLDEFF